MISAVEAVEIDRLEELLSNRIDEEAHLLSFDGYGELIDRLHSKIETERQAVAATRRRNHNRKVVEASTGPAKRRAEKKSVVRSDRGETESCERSTAGCAVDHSASSYGVGCETW